MKKYLLIIALFALPLLSHAQRNMKNLYEHFKDKKGVTIVQLDKDLISLYKKADISEEAEEMIQNLNSVDILNISLSKDNFTAEKIQKMVEESFNFDRYKMIKSSNHYKGFSKVFVKKDGEEVSELLVINSGWRDYNLILITGEIELGSLSKLAYALNIDGIENLHKVKQYNSSSIEMPSKEEMEKIKLETAKLKEKLKNNEFFKDGNFDSEKFNKYWDNINKELENLGEKIGKSVSEMVNTVIVDDEDFNITQNRSGKTVIKISPNSGSVYIVDGNKVPHSEIKGLNKGHIKRINVISETDDDKDKENYVIIYTIREYGDFISFKDNVLKFKYNNKIYKYNIKDKDFPGFIINGEKTKELKNIDFKAINQIRPITKDEKDIYDEKNDRIIIEVLH